MIKIIVKKDILSNMASVKDGKGNELEGNFWDFHNGCYGHWYLPTFNNLEEYIAVIKKLHENNGEKVEVIRKNYKYN